MPNKTAIEWCDYTSNPIVPDVGGWGCSKVSPGCDNCYSERWNKVRGNKRDFVGAWTFLLKEGELAKLARLPAGERTFVADMTDLFHPNVPWTHVCRLFDAMGSNPGHTYMVLTKRPGRMVYFDHPYTQSLLGRDGWRWPANVWAGTSVESQRFVPRLNLLALVAAPVRFVSVEPMLERVDLRPSLPWLSWVIAGGESGPAARPMAEEWPRDLRDQCQKSDTPFFFKQWGGTTPKAGGRELDGVLWSQFPR